MSRSRILQFFHDSLRVFFSLAISRPLRPVSPIWIMRPRSCSDDSWRCLHSHHHFHTFFQTISKRCRCFTCLRRRMQLCQVVASIKIIGTWQQILQLRHTLRQVVFCRRVKWTKNGKMNFILPFFIYPFATGMLQKVKGQKVCSTFYFQKLFWTPCKRCQILEWRVVQQQA